MLYILEIAGGVEQAITSNAAIAAAVNTHDGRLVNLERMPSQGGDDGLD
jgi:alanine dehydrogenase